MSPAVHEIQEPWEQVEEARGAAIVFSDFPQIDFAACAPLDTLWILLITSWSTSLSKSGMQWRLLTSLVCALQQKLLWWVTRCCSTPTRHSQMTTLPSRQLCSFFPLLKLFWCKAGSLTFACLMADGLMGEREANDWFMSDHHFKVLKILLANEINLGA